MNRFLRFVQCLLARWTWQMAWRDSRRSRRRLLLYAASIVLGIAALTALSSFGRQMQRAIQEQSKALLGADLVVSSRQPYSEEQLAFLETLGGEQAREVVFPSMVYFPKTEGTRLVQIRALKGGFPFYGALEAEPSQGVSELRAGRGALVERSLLDQFGAKVGDPVKVGDLVLPVAGALTQVPGETMAFGTIAPRVYVPLQELSRSGLLQQGSLARYKTYFKFPATLNVEEMVDSRRAEFRQLQLGFDTVAERQESLGRSLDHLLRFLNLIGFAALLLGGVGVASGIHVHMKQKLGTVATLRCLGCDVVQAFAIYFAQAIALGLLGAIAGAGLGLLVQFAVPVVLAEFIPFQLSAAISWNSVMIGIGVGFLICILFALLPLLPARHISPLAALRAGFGEFRRRKWDPLLWLAYALIVGGLVVFGISQSRRWLEGVAFALAIVAAFLVLAGIAWGMARAVRVLIRPSWPFVVRQGLANLYRPNNRTVLLMVSLGLGTFLVLTLYLVQANLLAELITSRRGNEGNAVLFGIQPDEKEGVLNLMKAHRLPVLEEVPMVSMRLQSIKGRTVAEIRRDPKSGIRNWVLNREYRSTYRARLASSETLLSGTWHERVADPEAPVPVSVEQGIAQNLKVTLGDEIVFDLQGVPVTTVVASIREVDWRRVSPNFFMVFPPGAIDDAPTVHVLVTRVESSEQSAALQRDLVRQFPNISAVDLTLVLHTIESVLAKVAFVIRFMAIFTVGTGLLVLAGTIVSGRYERLRESILLRTLGATRRQVLQVLTAEYLFLGVLAAATGVVLATAASWGLSVFLFKIKFGVYPLPMLAAVVTVAALTLTAGLLGNRALLNRPALEVLRAEG